MSLCLIACLNRSFAHTDPSSIRWPGKFYSVARTLPQSVRFLYAARLNLRTGLHSRVAEVNPRPLGRTCNGRNRYSVLQASIRPRRSQSADAAPADAIVPTNTTPHFNVFRLPSFGPRRGGEFSLGQRHAGNIVAIMVENEHADGG
jgi:hypothetical protein